MPALIVPEYLRTWCDLKQRTPLRHEQADIVRGQIEAERLAYELAQGQGIDWMVVDSSPLMTAVYSLEYFNDDALCAEALMHQSRYCLSLVMDDGIEWVGTDWQRDSPLRRASCQSRLVELLNSTGIGYYVIAGSAEDRLERTRALIAAAGVA